MFNHTNYVALGLVLCITLLIWNFAGFLSVGIFFLGIMMGVLLMEVFTEADEFAEFKEFQKNLRDMNQ
jgi:hypothetical protein